MRFAAPTAVSFLKVALIADSSWSEVCVQLASIVFMAWLYGLSAGGAAGEAVDPQAAAARTAAATAAAGSSRVMRVGRGAAVTGARARQHRCLSAASLLRKYPVMRDS